jgi:hypothetical protein
MNTSFSAYWHVDNNTKRSAGKHLSSVVSKNLDFFFAENKHPDIKTINLKFEDLPSHRFISKLSTLESQYENVYLKFTHPIKSSAFVRLATIWTSKILLFEKILEYTDADHIMWSDCVFATNKDIIATTISDRCIINRYSPDKLRWEIFGGMIKNNIPSVKISASVIKIPRYMIMDFINKYKECLSFVDDNYIIYDEEIVLTIMHGRYPEMFHLID